MVGFVILHNNYVKDENAPIINQNMKKLLFILWLYLNFSNHISMSLIKNPSEKNEVIIYLFCIIVHVHYIVI